MSTQINDEIFAANLVWLRKKYSLSQVALEKLTDCGTAYIRAIEKGRAYARLSRQTLDRMCLIFQVSPEGLTQQNQIPSDADQ